MIRRQSLSLVVTALAGLSLLAAPRAHAWNGTGHMTIADIAYDGLTPAAKAHVDALLQTQRDYGLWMSEMPVGYTDKARFAFMKAATWPDDIRGTPDSRPSWHYIDSPIVAPGYTPDPAAIVAPTPNAETQITAETALLTAPGIADGDRAVALCWVEHLIGDIHMPLHASTLYSPLFPHGDKGGNAERLTGDAFTGDALETAAGPHNLHALWDDALGNDRAPADIIQIADGLETASYARGTFPQLTQDTTVASWVQESSAVCQEVVYINETLPMTTAAGQAGDDPTVTVTLPPAYLSTLHAVADRQIALAGLRLADTLNTTFGKSDDTGR